MSGDTWFDEAACAGDNPNDWDLSTPRARMICKRCPVQTPCLTYALKNEEGYGAGGRGGMYADTTPEQRAQLAKKTA